MYAQLGDLFHDRFGKWLKSARYHDPFIRIDGVFDQHFILNIIELLSLFDREVLDVVEHLQNVRISTLLHVFLFVLLVEKAQRAEESCGEKFAPALFAVEIDVKQIAGIKLRFIP